MYGTRRRFRRAVPRYYRRRAYPRYSPRYRATSYRRRARRSYARPMYKSLKSKCRSLKKYQRYKYVNNPTNGMMLQILPKVGFVMLLGTKDGKVLRKFVRTEEAEKYTNKYPIAINSNGGALWSQQE